MGGKAGGGGGEGKVNSPLGDSSSRQLAILGCEAICFCQQQQARAMRGQQVGGGAMRGAYSCLRQ